jgi:ubiquinone/menaquinone biosynthesis C-methylase UbiE
MDSQLKKVKESFNRQAGQFESKRMSFSKAEYLQYTIDTMALSGGEQVLDVCAGTCASSRKIAQKAGLVVCLDATEGMLEEGRKKAEAEGVSSSMVFVKGEAEKLPFLPHSFDVVFCRLAFHHLLEPAVVFSEMDRVLKPSGKMVLIDMEAAPEELRDVEDGLERLRDPSHVKLLSRQEMESFFKGRYTIEKEEPTRIPVSLSAWLDLTGTPAASRAEIKEALTKELDGGPKTGFNPWMDGNNMFFAQRWLFILAVKK